MSFSSLRAAISDACELTDLSESVSLTLQSARRHSNCSDVSAGLSFLTLSYKKNSSLNDVEAYHFLRLPERLHFGRDAGDKRSREVPRLDTV